MTPHQEQALLDATALGLDDDLRAGYRRMLELIREGMDPRQAVAEVVKTFEGQYADLLAEGFSGILAQSVGTASVLAMQVGAVSLSARLYAESQSVGAVVAGIVDRHAKGFNDARALTLQLYEGYGFRANEPLKISPRNPKLPKYLRRELLTDPGLAGDLSRHFARVQAATIKTAPLKVAYMDAIDAMEKGAGDAFLKKKLDVAYHERMRYFANRIAQTELHRAYAERQAVELQDDTDVEYVQVRMSATHPRVDICDYFANVDRYGLGKGVYPKGSAPVPGYHPFCRCTLSPRLDIPLGTKAKHKEGAGRAWLREQGLSDGAKVMGSKDKLKAALKGADPVDILNANRDPFYRVKRVADVDGRNWPTQD